MGRRHPSAQPSPAQTEAGACQKEQPEHSQHARVTAHFTLGSKGQKQDSHIQR